MSAIDQPATARPEADSGLYTVGAVGIELCRGHMLEQFQREYPFYDRFLPVLCARLAGGDVVVDIGANVGDTAAAILSAKPDLHVVSIEADEAFFAILERNAARIREALPAATLTTVNALVGQDVSGVTMVGDGGTKHAEPGGTQESRTLTAIVADLGIGAVRLIKSDVDGYDYDVLRSCDAVLGQSPMLFFECQFDTRAQYRSYLRMLGWLAQEKGYQGYFLFDNFGQYVMHHRRPSGLREALDYVARQSLQARKTRTIHYFDMLAVGAGDVEMVRDVIRTYAGGAGDGPAGVRGG